MDDQTLIDRIKKRDQEAMVTLHDRYIDLVYSIAFRIVGDSAAAEECAQDAFMKAWQNAAQFDQTRGSLTGWLVGIARNAAIDRLRQRQQRYVVNSLDDTVESLLPDDNWLDRDRAQSLRMAIRALPPEQIQVIELSFFGGMSQNDIAEQLDIPLGTIKTRMRLGMQKLREAWLKNGDEE